MNMQIMTLGLYHCLTGGDDRRVLMWRTCHATMDIAGPGKSPKIMDAEHASNIFCLAFSNDRERLYSGGNDEQVIEHDTET